MNSVVEWRATTAARTGRPDRVALSVSLCALVHALVRVHVFVCACVCECMCGVVKACLFI